MSALAVVDAIDVALAGLPDASLMGRDVVENLLLDLRSVAVVESRDARLAELAVEDPWSMKEWER